MKRAATLETPETGTGSANPELFAHEWDPVTGLCKNPEVFALDGLPKDYSVVFRLGQAPDDASWRVATAMSDGTVALGLELLNLKYASFPDRAEALRQGLGDAQKFFGKDKRVLKVIAGVLAKLDTEQARGRSPANKADESPVPTPEPAEIAVEAIEANPLNERERPREYIDELAASIAREGLLQRIGVVLLAPSGDSLPGVPPAPRYRLVYGGCRLKAVRQLGQTIIRAEVYPVTLTPRHEWRLIKVENLKRRNPNPVEEAQGYADHMREFDLTQEEMAKEVGKSRPVIANALRVLELPEGVRELLAAGALSPAHGTALCRFKAWPEACEKLAELAVKHKTPAGQLEKNLPFGEELVDAKLAVDLFPSYHIDRQGVLKEFGSTEGFFIWHDKENYEHLGFCLDVKRGKEVVAAAELKAKEREERERQRYSSDTAKRDSSGELTPAAKRARQKKIDDNQENRLAVSAMGHAAIVRLAGVDDVDVHAAAVVAAEAVSHCGGVEVEEIAQQLGIKLPKNFEFDDDFGSLPPADALRLAAACIAQRETDDAMRYAAAPREEVEILTADTDAAALVAGWKKQIEPLVAAGKRAPEIQAQLRIPEFLAVTLVRLIKREARNAKEAAAAPVKPAGPGPELSAKLKSLDKTRTKLAALEKKVAAAAPKFGKIKAKKKGGRAVITDETRAQVKRAVEEGRTGAEIAKAVGISLPSVQNIKKALGLVRR